MISSRTKYQYIFQLQIHFFSYVRQLAVKESDIIFNTFKFIKLQKDTNAYSSTALKLLPLLEKLKVNKDLTYSVK